MSDTERTTDERIEVRLSERTVTIVEDDWPVVASAEDGNPDEDKEYWWIKVRRNKDDGRFMVHYCVRTLQGGRIPWHGGQLVGAIEQGALPAKIREIFKDEHNIPAAGVQAVINDLPSEDL